MSEKNIQTVNCYHCGNECEDEVIQFDEHAFCCTGCQTVYDILKTNDLCNYYEIEQKPGISFKSKKNNRYEYLEDSSVVEKLLDFKDENVSKVHFYLPQIHCYSCVWLLEKLFILNNGIGQSRVDYMRKEVSVTFDHHQITLKEVVELLARIGYEPKIQLSDVDPKKKKSVNHELYLKIGIAGFCFGNIMLLSFPEYISASFKDSEYAGFFSVVSLFLGLPILLYSGVDYLKSAYYAIKSKRINMDVPISMGIISIYLASVIMVFAQQEAGYMDSLSGLVFFLLLGKLFQLKTFHHLSFERDYKSYFPIAVTQLINGEEKTIPFEKIEPGQRLFIRNEEIIPADAYLLSSDAQIDFSFVTGEELPVRKVAGEIIHAGGRLKGASIEVEVKKLPSQSYLTRLWNNRTENQFVEEENFESLTDKVSKYFTYAIIGIAISAAIFWLPVNPNRALWALVSVLIVACPCALALAEPVALGNALRLLAKHKMYLKNTNVLEKLSESELIIFDKTGTLTHVEKAEVQFVGAALTPDQKVRIKSVLGNSSHPLSRKLYTYFQSEKKKKVSVFQENPGKGIQAEIDDRILKIGSARFLGVASTTNKTAVYIKEDEALLGYFTIGNFYREGIQEAALALSKTYRLAVLSGDSEIERNNVSKIFGPEAELYFRQSPFDKQAFVQAKNQVVSTVMVGDGLNDSGALKEANVGIAVTDDISQFTPASGAILEGDAVHLLPQFFRYAKNIRKVVYGAFLISFLYNFIGLFFSVQGLLSPLLAAVLMPFSSISVVLFSFLATNYFSAKIK